MSTNAAKARHLLALLEAANAPSSAIYNARDLVRQIEQIERMASLLPAVEPPEGSIVEFRRRFTPRGKVYTYVGTRRNHRWFFTGRMFDREGATWAAVVATLTNVGENLLAFQNIRVGEEGDMFAWADHRAEYDRDFPYG